MKKVRVNFLARIFKYLLITTILLIGGAAVHNLNQAAQVLLYFVRLSAKKKALSATFPLKADSRPNKLSL